MAAAAPIFSGFTAAGAAVPDSAFRRGAGRRAGGGGNGGDFFSPMTTATDATAAAAATNPFVASAAPVLAPPQRVVAEYVYLGGSGTDLRSVTRVVDPKVTTGAAAGAVVDVSMLPLIAVDGTGTRQASAFSDQSALFLKPRSCWPDPLRGGGALLVLCEAYSPPPLDAAGWKIGGGESIRNRSSENLLKSESRPRASLSPHPTNNRVYAERAARAAASEEPLFAITQQYLLCEGDGTPLGWTREHGPPQASCYGSPPSTASNSALRRGKSVADAHLAACLSAGLSVTGFRAEAASGHWSFSLGPLPPLDAADQLWAARWLLHAVASDDLRVSFDAALPSSNPCSRFDACWDGNGCRVKLSTAATRGGGSGESALALRDALGKLERAHARHMMVYGAGASARCDKARERAERGRDVPTSSEEIDVAAFEKSPSPPFAPAMPGTPPSATSAGTGAGPVASEHLLPFSGVEDPRACVRVPAAVALHGRGHLEDRRPAGGCDPYMALSMLLCTVLGLPLPAVLFGGGPAGEAARKRGRGEGDGDCRRKRTTAVAAASGSGESNVLDDGNADSARRFSLACDEQVGESAQGDQGDDEEEGEGDDGNDDESETDDDVRSSDLLLGDDDDLTTPLTPTRDADGATTVLGPDNDDDVAGNDRSATSPERRRSELDDDATSSSR